MRLSAVLVAVATLALAACGSGSDTDKASAPPEPTTAAVASTPTTTAESAPEPKSESTADKRIEAEREFFMALDDQAVALDDVLDRAVDGDASADAALAKIRNRVTDLVYGYAVDGGDTTAGISAFQNAIADAVSALNSSDQRKLVKARVAGQDARAQFADDLVGP